MENKNFSVWDLERHETKDITDSHINGELTVIWRDWDNLIKNHPKMQKKLRVHIFIKTELLIFPALMAL